MFKKTMFIKAIIEFFGLKIFRNYSLDNMGFLSFFYFPQKPYGLNGIFFSKKPYFVFVSIRHDVKTEGEVFFSFLC